MKQILKQIKKIEIHTKKLVDGLISGNYHSVFKGQGIEFSDIREYVYGDDIRSIDWNVTARMNKPFVKEFIEERDLRVYFFLDVSGSLNFGNMISKSQKIIELVATLMFSAVRNNDAVGLFLSTDKVEKFIKVRKGRRHVLKLLQEILSYEPKSKQTNLKESLKFVSKVLKKRGIIFIISDFLNDDFVKPLKILKNKHDIVAIRVVDSREKEIPSVGLIELEDEETGEQILIDTNDKEFLENYKKEIQKHEEKLKRIFRKHKIDVLEVLTDEPYDKPLKKFFRQRVRKR